MNVSPAANDSGGSQEPGRSDEQIEVRNLGGTHQQFFRAGVCLGTVRIEYAAACLDAIRISDKGTVPQSET